MLEYHAHIASLDAAKAAVLAMGDPELSNALAETKEALDQHAAIAQLGCCLDALVTFAESDEQELKLLRQAGDIWQRGLKIYSDLETARLEFELSLVRTDLLDAVNVLQLGINRLYDLSQDCGKLIQEIQALHDAISPLDHLRPHPRQSDLPSPDWTWGDAFLGRRTFALVQSLSAHAGDARGRAFAMGALGGYAGNVAGSAFLGAVVGGPRRLHRYRDRLARNSLGSWMHKHAGTPSPSELAHILLLDGNRDAPALPADLAMQLRSALAGAYPSRPLPDLDLGYRRLLEHLELLDRFRMPEPPEPPIVPLSTDGSIQPSTFNDDFLGNDNGSVGNSGTPSGPPDITADPLNPGPSNSKKSNGDACLAILAVLGMFAGVTFVIFLIWCIDRRIREKDCSPGEFLDASSDPPDPRDPPITQNELQILREPENCGELLQNVFELQMRLWQAFEHARSFLAVTGLIYPPPETLAQPLQRQFLVSRSDLLWPRREDSKAAETYHRYPATPTEQPAIKEVFPADRQPDWLLHSDLVDNTFTVAQIAVEAFRAMHGPDSSFNLDQDADRGYHHPCWSVSPGTSIIDPVLSVDLLDFDEE